MEHVESLLPAGKKWKLVWHDEFDGTELDMTKWSYRRHLLHRKHDTFTDQGAKLDGKGNLVLSLIEKDGQYYSTQLQTGENYLDRPAGNDGPAWASNWPIAKFSNPKFMHRYGYYEIRCKLQTQPGWWSAFWLQSPCIGATPDPVDSGIEVDIMENFTRDNTIYHNNHWNGYGPDHKSASSGKIVLNDTPDGFHVFGLDWSPNGYVYYVDGKETWRCAAPVSHREQFILISTECMGYRKGMQIEGFLCQGDGPHPKLQKAVLPDAFIVDYVRVFDEIC